MRYLFIFVAVLAGGCDSADQLPAHSVSEEPLTQGSARLQVDAPAEITREECEALVRHYRDRAGTDGQVSVHKPSEALAGQPAPWCVDNLDGAGVRFNDGLF